MRKILVLLAGLALLAAACNGDGDGGTEETTTTAAQDQGETTTTASLPPVAQGVPNDETVALNRELYGRLLEQKTPGEFDGRVIFGNVDPGVIPDVDDVVAGCTYLRGRFIISSNYAGPLPPTDVEKAFLFSAPDLNGNDVDFFEVVYSDLKIDPRAFVGANYESNNGQISLHYVLLPAPRWKWAPDNDPTPSAPPPDDIKDPYDGTGTVLVLDTETPANVIEGVQDPAAEHGDFIGSVIARLGAKSDLKDPTDFSSTGRSVITELSLYNTVVGDSVSGYSAVNASFGAYPCQIEGSDRPILPLLLPEGVQQIINAGAVLVAAAGNDNVGDWPRFLPAGYGTLTQELVGDTDTAEKEALATTYAEFERYVVSVGACEPTNVADPTAGECTAKAADFSNHGDWVEVYEPGVGVLGPYESTIIYTYQANIGGELEQVTFDNLDLAIDEVLSSSSQSFLPHDALMLPPGGFVAWDGTSFAAPHVAAAIAGNVSQEEPDALTVCADLFSPACG